MLMLPATFATADAEQSGEEKRSDASQVDTGQENAPSQSSHQEATQILSELELSTSPIVTNEEVLVVLDNGVVLDGKELSSLDGNTSGFRFKAGYSLPRLPRLDIGAEIAYLESEETPAALAGRQILLNTTTLNGALTAGIRIGQLTLFAKSGLAEWSGETETHLEENIGRLGGTAHIYGLGARMEFGGGVVGHLDYERIDAPVLEHLNLTTARLAYYF